MLKCSLRLRISETGMEPHDSVVIFPILVIWHGAKVKSRLRGEAVALAQLWIGHQHSYLI